jgi:hypothetical protein
MEGIKTSENCFEIYQIKDEINAETTEFQNRCFVSMSEIKSLGLKADNVNEYYYTCVYSGTLTEKINTAAKRNEMLDKIFHAFNINRPADYSGRSVSVSDVIVLKYDNKISAYFVDSIGFVKLRKFFGEKK